MKFLKNWFWAICMFLGLVGFLVVWFFIPRNQYISTIWDLVFKFLIYAFILLGIATFPNKIKNGYMLTILPFIAFLGYIIPRISYFGYFGAELDKVAFGEFYTALYLLNYPMITVATAFAYRIGGGTPGNTLKIPVCGMLIIFSGFLDIMWHLINPVALPEHIYGSHLVIRFGRPPLFSEVIIFALCHIPLIIGVLLLPLDRWIKALVNKIDNALASKKTAGSSNIGNGLN